MKKRENLAKAVYDLGKLVFAVLAVGPIVSVEAFNFWILIGGTIFTILIFILAYLVDSGG